MDTCYHFCKYFINVRNILEEINLFENYKLWDLSVVKIIDKCFRAIKLAVKVCSQIDEEEYVSKDESQMLLRQCFHSIREATSILSFILRESPSIDHDFVCKLGDIFHLILTTVFMD
jgi:hypothetical protein